MPDLIENGFFAADDLSPWERCVDNELGEAWTCLEDDEPGFPRLAWHYTREGSLTDLNWVFLSEYNLLMTSDDGVTQRLGPDALAGGDLTLWAHCTPIDREAGALYAFVCYRDHTFNYGSLTRDELRRFAGPTRLSVPVADRPIEKVVICVVGSDAPWYVDGISLPAAEAKASARLHRPARYLENRVALLEKQVDRLFAMIARGLPPVRRAPRPGKRWRKAGTAV